jgi:FkbM family methyltransferase
MRMFLDPKDSLGLSTWRAYEPLETELLKKLIQKGDCVVDIGAHIGYYTLIFSKCVGPEGYVFSFEPELRNFEILKRNIEVNRIRNVALENKAVSNANGKILLFLNENDWGDHRIYDTNDSRKAIYCDSIRLDDYFTLNHKIALIKIDIQGGEGLALQGMREALIKNRDTKILMEFWPSGLRLAGTEPQEVLKFLNDLGFNFYVIKNNKKQIEGTNIEELRRISGYINLLCIHDSIDLPYLKELCT